MDINCFSHDPLNMEDSNPGRVEYSPGGVGRNIAENLHRLGTEVRFISVIGDDPGGELIKAYSASMGLNIEHSFFMKSAVNSVYIALMDSNGEMKLALADMEILDRMTTDHLESKAAIIKKSSIVVLDANLSPEIIRFILDRFGTNEPQVLSPSKPLFFLDAVSAKKAPKAASRIGSFDTIKLGRVEAAAISGIELPEDRQVSREKLDEAAAWFHRKGVRRVFITLGKEGVYLAIASKAFYAPVKYVPPVNTSGGGDAFMAGIAYGTLQGWDDEKTVSFSMAMARITVQSKSTVSPEMNLEAVLKELQ
jgi:pseudouridine kinase